jgi:zinc and cadmium transporter
MCVIALVGGLTVLIKESTLQKIILPLVGFAAGTLVGGAFFHMIPTGLPQWGKAEVFFLWVCIGFAAFFLLEQIMQWRHDHRSRSKDIKPLSYIILIADGLHNFIGGLAVAGTFLLDIRLGIAAWVAAAVHEVPQELGDFGILIHGGMSKPKALLLNVISSLTFLLGGVLAYVVSRRLNVSFLVPLAAGNFIYIATSDLIPEIKHQKDIRLGFINFLFFLLGLAMMWILVVWLE